MTLRDGMMITALGGLAAGTWWLTWTGQDEPVIEAQERFVPDFFMDGAHIVDLDSDGQPKAKLLAKSLIHYPDDDSTDLTNPDLTMYKQGAAPWHIVSERASVSGGGDLIHFQGDVTANRDASDGTRPMRLVTRNLRVRTDDNYAETDEHAAFLSAGNRLEGVGMRAWMDTPARLRLLSDVRSIYESQ